MILMFLSFLSLAEENFLGVAKEEMNRNFSELTLPNQPKPYYIGYHFVREQSRRCGSVFGALLEQSHTDRFRLYADVRVGSYKLDNRNFEGGYASSQIRRTLPLDPSPLSLKRSMWLATDTAYKNAVQEYSSKIASLQTDPKEDYSDFLTAPSVKYKENSKPKSVDLSAITKRLSYNEKPFLETFAVNGLNVHREHSLINTEGSEVVFFERYSVLYAQANAKAEDGANLKNLRWWIVKNPNDFHEKKIRAELERMTDWLEKMQTAPIEEDYLGPVIFEEDAAVEFFRQLLPPQIVGTPPSSEPNYEYGESNMVIPSSRIGRRLFKDRWVVEDDPQRKGLLGSYVYDYEGVRGEKRLLVKNGVVRNLLMSRTPRAKFDASSGHGRGELQDRMSAMPSNVMVKAPKNHRMQALRKKALKLAKQIRKEYVIVVRKLVPLELNDNLEIAFSGSGPLAGLTAPLEAYRLYKDGREEPIRGLQFLGVDRRTLKDIVMAGPQSEWKNMFDLPPSDMRYTSGYYSYGTSWSAPSILISELELRGSGGGEKHVLPAP
ncbi:MAG: metallopeptidase TldD-related protein [Myxococcota bacterium]|nr:metallopeptidase TldD-related protein [Myxococcota bacterium]